eukprot:SAG31_NODE_20108_length_583_cov_1.595041_1_plen_169_part_10
MEFLQSISQRNTTFCLLSASSAATVNVNAHSSLCLCFMHAHLWCRCRGCASACSASNQSVAGVVDGRYCFCGTRDALRTAGARAANVPLSQCEQKNCSGAPTERDCGGTGRMLAYTFACSAVRPPDSKPGGAGGGRGRESRHCVAKRTASPKLVGEGISWACSQLLRHR